MAGDAKDWPLLLPALTISRELEKFSDNALPHEVLKIDDDITTLVFDLAGTDYAITLMLVPKPRARNAIIPLSSKALP